jgi:drug/metabolite transporter (DMT)-like permease
MAALASKDGLAKSFIDEMGPFQIIWIQFTGTFIVMGLICLPGFGGDPLGYYLGLASGILMGLYFIANRRLAGAQPPLLNIAHNGLMGAVALTPFLPLFWEPVSASIHSELIILVLLAIVGQGLMISSFIFAPAVVIAPYAYALLVFAALIGYFSFGAIPEPLTWVGIAMIVASGLTIAFRERKLSSQ